MGDEMATYSAHSRRGFRFLAGFFVGRTLGRQSALACPPTTQFVLNPEVTAMQKTRRRKSIVLCRKVFSKILSRLHSFIYQAIAPELTGPAEKECFCNTSMFSSTCTPTMTRSLWPYALLRRRHRCLCAGSESRHRYLSTSFNGGKGIELFFHRFQLVYYLLLSPTSCRISRFGYAGIRGVSFLSSA